MAIMIAVTGPATISTSALAAPQAKISDGWIINQKSQLFGEQLLLISPIGIKSANPKSSMTILMTPPFETVTAYNDQTKSVFQTPVKTFRSPMQKTYAIFNSNVLGEAPMEKTGTARLFGFTMVKYQSTKAYDMQQARLRKTDHIPSSNPRIIYIQSTEDFHLPAGAGTAQCRLYGLPLVPGIPLQVLTKDNDLTPASVLQSTQCIKTKVSPNDFMVPHSYKRVRSIEEITKSNVTEDAMQLFGP